ncbi:MAG: hypothetical protein LBE12_07475, partial [Planctomycetaceae bacterium]|nr:hypothetical protein [Planctomycetaceae bacterium]
REHRDQVPGKEKRVIYGALAGAVFQKHIIKSALQEGFFVITQSGDTMKIENPKNFKAKEF